MKIAALIHTCDKYSWTWPIFFSCLNKSWDYRYPTYFTNEVVDYDCGKAFQIKTGEGPWSWRLRHALESIEADHIIYLQEDFWTKYIEHYYLNAILNVHVSYGADITKLGTNYEFSVDKIATMGHLPISEQRKNSQYIMSHQPIAIFRKQYLIDVLDYRSIPEGPSEFELGVTEDINNGKIETKSICVGSIYIPNRSTVWAIEHGVRKGELIPEAREFLVGQGYEALIPPMR